MNVIEIKNLTKLYGNGRGIKNLNLTVEQGDILGLLGPNGSGKTTAMKAILNLVNAEGSVKVFGMDLHDNFESIMQRTGALIESPAIYKDLSAYQNVTFLISSHMAGEIEKTCNKVAVIYESELIATSTTEDALRLYPSMEDYFLSVVKDRRGEIII